MRKIHKWVGLIIAIQFVLWLASGVVMSLFDAKKVAGREFRIKPPAAALWPASALPVDAVLANASAQVMNISSGWLLDRPVYMLVNDKATWMVDALKGTPVALDAALATRIAQASYSGSGTPTGARLLKYTLETRKHKEPVWGVNFNDADETTVYVSANTGKVLEHRNSTWRLFDFFWMLHIMDYAERENFNNKLLVTSAIGGLFMALTGIWLLFTSLRLAEFIPQRMRRASSINVFGEDGSKLRAIEASQGDTVFQALARGGLQLPSNCGGGQSCGLCEVRCLGKAPEPTSADRALLSPEKLAAGYRLACNLPVDGSVDVEVAGAAALATEYAATVTSVKAVAPFLREITIRPSKPVACRPGSYIQVHVPDYARDASHIVMPEHHRDDWQRVQLPEKLVNPAPLRRSYSLAVPVEQAGGQLTLLVRFIPGQQPGKGSSYMYTLKEGDTVRFSGAFGDFAIKPGGREKVFIGGGAGMAPLRAMIHSLLQSGAREPLHFWYGARSQRDAPYVDEMQAFASKHPNFKWQLVLSEDDDAGGAAKGYVHEAARDALLRTHPNLQACDFYVCGPPAMLAATRELLKELGVSDERIAFDDFKI
ncbi:2Fe-2S iron-sulfur cluster-binding protein [Massilia sp. GCM10020059]|uniref:2Fe-2S iron-sulfur cluster-binding protein n=2 Tax=Massilia agrisoli TaxID=2892444 RepID=A0ABS8IY85_9BURK|nr:2Fe-2S iron-sulfur cluster-binding protein [Massilia agrisoli]